MEKQESHGPARAVAIIAASQVEPSPAGPLTAPFQSRARASGRLAGRLLRPLGGSPVLAQLARRLRCATTLTEVVVAVSASADDDALLAAVRTTGARVFRGAVHDQLARLAGCIDWLGLPDDAVVVRVPGDHPLVDWGYVDAGVRALRERGAGALEFQEDQAEELCAGLSAAFLTAATVRQVDQKAVDPLHRADPLLYVLEHPGEVGLARAALPEALDALRGSYRLVLQTAEDLAVHEAIYLRLYEGQPLPTAQAIEFLDGDPVVASLNRGVLCRGDTRPASFSGWRAR